MRTQRTTLFRQFIVRLGMPLLATLLLALGANVLVGYNMAYKEQQHRQQILSKAYAQSLIKPLWDCDDKTATGIMESMMQTEAIDGSVLHTACTGHTLSSGVTTHNIKDGMSFRTSHKLNYFDESGRGFEVGTLQIFFSPVGIMHSAADSLWFYLTVTTFMAMSLVGVALLIFRNLISRPLTTFQQAIEQHGTNPSFKVALPTVGRNDELTDVFTAYDRLMGTIVKQQDELFLQARIDPLTGLGNRLLLEECFDGALKRAQELQGIGYVLLFDLDGFKPINDTLGHAAGDAVLKAVALRLQKAVGEDDAVIRLGGDEFVVIAAAHAQPRDAAELVQRIRSHLGEPLSYEGHALTVGASVGVTRFDASTVNCDALLSEADQSMYEDKLARKAAR